MAELELKICGGGDNVRRRSVVDHERTVPIAKDWR